MDNGKKRRKGEYPWTALRTPSETSKSIADVFSCVYMTGILPIKKYNTESALNNFTEYSMVEPGDVSPLCSSIPKSKLHPYNEAM